MEIYLFVFWISCFYLSTSASESAGKSRIGVKTFTIPSATVKPTESTEKRKWFWCQHITCQPNDHCNTVVHPLFFCCPACGCTNQFGEEMDVGHIYKLKRPNQPCYMCKCERRYSLESKFADCMRVKCPFNAELLTCKKKITPAGSCCEVCDDDKMKDPDPYRPSFPPFPTDLMD